MLDRFVVAAAMKINIARMELPIQEINLIGWDVDVV